MSERKRSHLRRRLIFFALIAAISAFAAAYRFALRYRAVAGWPRRSAVEGSPADFGLAYEDVRIPGEGCTLAGWFVPAQGTPLAPKRRAKADAAAPAASTEPGPPPAPRPGIVVVHGWESNRARTFAHVRYLHAAGFHCLVFDVRGHGDNPEEDLPIEVPEFAADTVAAARWLAARSEVSAVGVLGHSMGGAGAIVAAADEPKIQAVVSLSAPADIVSLTRKTFDMAELHVPRLVATPLAYFTAAVLLAPRRHSLDEASATAAVARYDGPLLLIHGADDHGVPAEHAEMIAAAARAARTEAPGSDASVETLILPGFGHRWLYEDGVCRRKIAAFFAQKLGGISPVEAGKAAEATVVRRPDEPIYGFGPNVSNTPPTRP